MVFGSGDNQSSLLNDVVASMKKIDAKKDAVVLKSQPRRAFRGQLSVLSGLTGADQEPELNAGNDDPTKHATCNSLYGYECDTTATNSDPAATAVKEALVADEDTPSLNTLIVQSTFIKKASYAGAACALPSKSIKAMVRSNLVFTPTKLFEFVISEKLPLSRARKPYLMRGSSGYASTLNNSGARVRNCSRYRFNSCNKFLASSTSATSSCLLDVVA
ncbi:hypothetical protein Tco_0572414 [Tanacetum coccineum]